MKFIEDDGVLYYPVIDSSVMQTVDDILNDSSYIAWTLYPVAIYDYVDPDNSDEQGWLQEIENGEVNGDVLNLVQYLGTESFEECVEDNGFTLTRVPEFVQMDYDTGKRKVISDKDAVKTAIGY